MQYQQQPATVVCEVCGNLILEDYAFSIMACWVTTGGARLAAYACPSGRGGQHFGCCPEHAMQALLACLQHDEHLSVEAFKKRREALPRVAEDHADLYDERQNPDFHIIGKLS